MKYWEVKYKRQVIQRVTDVVKADTMEEAIRKSKSGDDIESSDEGEGTDEVLQEYEHKVKDVTDEYQD